MTMDNCKICDRRILRHAKILKCCACSNMYHLKCLPMVSPHDSIYVNRESSHWLCICCASENFPFNHLTDESVFLESLSESWVSCKDVPYARLQEMAFNPFELNIDNPNLPNFDSDPDIQYFYDMTCIDNTNRCEYYLEDRFNKEVENNDIDAKLLSCLHVNIRSVPKNLEYFDTFLSSIHHVFTVIGMSETWLKDSNAELYDLDGYKHEYLCRQGGKKGGGVSLFVKTNTDIARRNDLCINDVHVECLVVEIMSRGQACNILTGVVYRPPNADIGKFNESISDILNRMKSENKTIYLLGDFNINLLESSNHLPSAEFLECMYSFGLFPLINKPTRVNERSATLIDNIYTNDIMKTNTLNGIFFVEITDHFPVFSITMNELQNKCVTLEVHQREYSRENIDKFSKQVKAISWDDVYNEPQGDVAFEIFFRKYCDIYYKCFPLKIVKSRYMMKKIWLSDGLKNSIKTKNKLYLRYLKNKDSEAFAKYKTYKTQLKRLMRMSERKHYAELLEKYKSNSKKLWMIIKEIINKRKTTKYPSSFIINNSETSNCVQIANSFNNYFINVGKVLADKVPHSHVNPVSYIKNTNLDSIVINPVDEHEIVKVINSLKESSPGWDGIHAKVLKSTFYDYIKPVTYICNLCLIQGSFPDSMKIAKVVPLFKSNDSKQISNYRPVSILPVLSKILEKLMYKRLLSFITNMIYFINTNLALGETAVQVWP